MSDYVRRNTRWRDLDMAQMHLWPNAPRRWTVAFLAALLLGLGVFYWIVPRYERLTEAQKQVLDTQNQIIKAYQTSPVSLTNIPPIRQIKRSEESVWLSDLASLAHNHHLNAVVLKTHELDETERTRLREQIQTAVKNNPQWVNKQGGDLPLDWLAQVGWVDISAQGSYADVLAFVSDLGAHDEWLAVGGVELNAINQTQVHWHGGFWYYKEATHVPK
ncbi:MAG: hypothetical protein H6R05_1654 [Burkholderiaceae bacterium]|nr:hypothetical protein [Burkholderiaceae bacterium]